MDWNSKIKISEQLNEEQVQKLLLLFENEWFTKGRNKEDVLKMLASTSIILGFSDADSGELLGFARVITDFVYKAFIFDVIVDEKFRHKGLGDYIMQKVTTHPKVKNVQHIELYCPDMITPFYEKIGFKKRTSHLLRKQTDE